MSTKKKRIIDLSFKDERDITYKPKKGTISDYAVKFINLNPDKSDIDICRKIREKFPNSKVSVSHIKWYKNAMRKGGYDV